MSARVLSVGQCGPDTGSISRFLRGSFGAQMVTADTCDEALAALGKETFQLVLVNRILDADGSAGLDLIRAIKADPQLASVAVMLVSNYAEAHTAAVSLGALPGFGKADVGRPTAIKALEPIMKLNSI